jgi:hypothetical protein
VPTSEIAAGSASGSASSRPSKHVVVLQPSYLPWLGYLDQYLWADDFVVYDDVQYDKHGWRNRNRIWSPTGPQWITVPIKTKGQESPIIREVQIDNQHNPRWRKKQLDTIRQTYSKAAFFDFAYPALESYLSKEWNSLLDLNMAGMEMLCQLLGIPWKATLSSEMEIGGRKTDRLLGICEALQATDYLSGDAAKDYLEVPMFDEIGVTVHWHSYHHPEYRQKSKEFVPYLSIVDLLFWCGPESLAVLASERNSGRVPDTRRHQ